MKRNTHLSLALVGALLALVVATLGCQTMKRSSLRPLESKESFLLRLKSLRGRQDKIHYYSTSKLSFYEDTQLVRKKDETVDFLVSQKTQNVMGGDIYLEVETLKKDGFVPLNSMAFPEVGEKIDLHLTNQGTVKKAGSYSKKSVFYVPLISLPKNKVLVGDTWVMNTTWEAPNGVPLKMELVSIFNKVFQCFKIQRCAEIEVSGRVEIIGAQKKVQFSSDLVGKILFNIDSGTMVLTEVKSIEEVTIGKMKTKVKGCIRSVLQEPKKMALDSVQRLECDPLDKKVTWY